MDLATAGLIVSPVIALLVVVIGARYGRALNFRSWERDRAKDAYVELLERAQDVADAASKLASGHDIPVADRRSLNAILFRTEMGIELLGSHRVELAAVFLRQTAVGVLLEADMMASFKERLYVNEGPFAASYKTAMGRYQEARAAFVGAARADLRRK